MRFLHVSTCLSALKRIQSAEKWVFCHSKRFGYFAELATFVT